MQMKGHLFLVIFFVTILDNAEGGSPSILYYVACRDTCEKSERFKGEDLVGCIDQCLSSGLDCTQMLWDPVRDVCCMYSKANGLTTPGPCIAFAIQPQPPLDLFCMKSVPAVSKNDFETTFPVKSAERCVWLCNLWKECKHVMWSKTNKTCLMSTKDNTDAAGDQQTTTGDVSAVKKQDCDFRCNFLNFNAQKIKLKSINPRNMKACMDVLPTADDKAVLWDEGEKKCSLDGTNAPVKFERPVNGGKTHIALSQKCTLNTKGLCYKSSCGQTMSCGHVTGNLTESDCAEMCREIGNCAAVTWNLTGNDCKFHRYVDHFEHDTAACVHEVVLCKDVPDGKAVFTPCFTNDPAAPIQIGVGIYYEQNVDSVKVDGPGYNVSHVTALQCALLCNQGNCLAFTHISMMGSSNCCINPESLDANYHRSYWTQLRL